MAQRNPIKFLLNQEQAAKTGSNPVDSPAFSLTKVMAAAAAVVTPVTALLVEAVDSIDFTSGQVVTLVLGVLAFLAVTSAADVLARGMAASASLGAAATTQAAAAQAGAARAAAEASRRTAELAVEASKAEAEKRWAAGYPGLVMVQPPWPGRLSAEGQTQPLTVHALTEADGAPCYLCRIGDDDDWRWLAANEIVLGTALPDPRPATSPQTWDPGLVLRGLIESVGGRSDNGKPPTAD
jgi:hypothetical protein